MKIMKAVTAAILMIACASVAAATEDAVRDRIDEQIESELSGWVDVEDRERIETLVRSGDPQIDWNSERCEGDQDDLGTGDRALCLQTLRLPAAVFAEIRRGATYRFVNVSDYDQRATRLYAFRHAGLLDRDLSPEDLAILMEAFAIPVDAGPSLEASPYIWEASPESRGYLSPLSGLFFGEEWQQEGAAYEYAMDLLEGAPTTTYTWRAEVSLYPGGGFTTSFHIVVTDRHLLFFKIEGWNA